MHTSFTRNPIGRLVVTAVIFTVVGYAAAWSLTKTGLFFWSHPKADFTVAYGTPHVDWEWIGVGMTFGLLPAGIIALVEQVRMHRAHRRAVRHSSEGAIWLVLAVIAACAIGFGLFGHS